MQDQQLTTKTNPINVETSKESSALYVYGGIVNSKTIFLRFGEDPIPLSCGYVKLVGAVNSDFPEALIEVGGKGVRIEEGNAIGDYKIADINEREVKLCLKK
ncbi:MAG: hypothetical protein FD145_400 [Candidatus Saganbacteria bacterium]|uniref:Uncharacterized protein n=1 Tax=Candidatus Saganbacteria bacterium TaxID=2575572 RepID=A0A833L223_UNCSA|nr:MAG: hypothetical protein FD145_400 [Candidatus Saganbacteria bacterium]